MPPARFIHATLVFTFRPKEGQSRWPKRRQSLLFIKLVPRGSSFNMQEPTEKLSLIHAMPILTRKVTTLCIRISAPEGVPVPIPCTGPQEAGRQIQHRQAPLQHSCFNLTVHWRSHSAGLPRAALHMRRRSSSRHCSDSHD